MFPFRKSGDPHALSVAMTGVRLGDQLLQIGCADPILLGAIGSKVGLSGRAAVAVSNETMETRARRGAEKAGVLIDIERTDFKKLAFDDGTFNLVVVDSTEDLLGSLSESERRVCVSEALRVLSFEQPWSPERAGLWWRKYRPEAEKPAAPSLPPRSIQKQE